MTDTSTIALAAGPAHAQPTSHHGPQRRMTDGRRGASVKDPVCGMTVDPHTAKHRHRAAGRPYYFCSAGCRDEVRRRSGSAISRREADAPAPVPEGTIYTCPMHPEIRQVGPGSCPICGMALEPELVTADSGAQSRARRHDAALLDRPRADAPGLRRSRWAGTSPACTCWLGQQPVELAPARARDAGRAVGRLAVLRARLAVAASPRNLNMFTLIAMGTGVAWVYSVVATLLPGAFPAGVPRP